MSKPKALLVIIIAIAAVAVAKKTGLGLVLEFPTMIGTLWLMFKYREQIANWFLSFKMPTFLAALVSFYPFMLFEENINCLPTGCKIIPDTVQILTFFILAFLLLCKLFKAKGVKVPLILFAIWGIFIELTYGAGATAFRQLPIGWFVFIFLWVGASYIYVAVIPLTILLKGKKNAQ